MVYWGIYTRDIWIVEKKMESIGDNGESTAEQEVQNSMETGRI